MKRFLTLGVLGSVLAVAVLGILPVQAVTLFTLNIQRTGTGDGIVYQAMGLKGIPTSIRCGNGGWLGVPPILNGTSTIIHDTKCSAQYSTGNIVLLTANPAAGSYFTGWTGCDFTRRIKNLNDCIVLMNANHSVTAKFTLTH